MNKEKKIMKKYDNNVDSDYIYQQFMKRPNKANVCA